MLSGYSAVENQWGWLHSLEQGQHELGLAFVKGEVAIKIGSTGVLEKI